VKRYTNAVQFNDYWQAFLEDLNLGEEQTREKQRPV
jgi:hypothetical protein